MIANSQAVASKVTLKRYCVVLLIIEIKTYDSEHSKFEITCGMTSECSHTIHSLLSMLCDIQPEIGGREAKNNNKLIVIIGWKSIMVSASKVSSTLNFRYCVLSMAIHMIN